MPFLFMRLGDQTLHARQACCEPGRIPSSLHILREPVVQPTLSLRSEPIPSMLAVLPNFKRQAALAAGKARVQVLNASIKGFSEFGFQHSDSVALLSLVQHLL